MNDRRVREEIRDGARDEFDIAARCGAGGSCGGCVPVITEILAEHGLGSACCGAVYDGGVPGSTQTTRLVDDHQRHRPL